MNRINLCIKLVFISIILYTSNIYAQFTGGTGCGFSYNTSAPLQINSAIYNNIAVMGIINPNNNDTIAVNTPFNIDFSIQNNGTLPILPTHGINIKILVDNDTISQNVFNFSDTVHSGQNASISYLNQINIADTGLHELCVQVSGTNFAQDTILSDNKVCISLKIIDFSGIDQNDLFQSPIVFYNPNNNLLYINSFKDIKSLKIFNLLGKEVLITDQNYNNDLSINTIDVSSLVKGLYIACVYIDNAVFPTKFIK
ncbi:MAG: T9SS type A sorting domain-containing protein [Bacteroidales bacterium]|nr:T9SS type A sorting domain-containing protein [Bacteroidales bacterium]